MVRFSNEQTYMFIKLDINTCKYMSKCDCVYCEIKIQKFVEVYYFILFLHQIFRYETEIIVKKV